jgi:cytochrome bd-type quinol oxidase subunit 1
MPLNRLRVLAAALLVAILIPTLVSAQDLQQSRLRWPTIAAGAAATADWATTYHALKYYKVQEQNPVLKPFQSTPGRLVTMGGMIDVAGISAWNLTIGPKHPKMAAAGLWTMTAFRAYLAIHNHINEHRSERR